MKKRPAGRFFLVLRRSPGRGLASALALACNAPGMRCGAGGFAAGVASRLPCGARSLGARSATRPSGSNRPRFPPPSPCAPQPRRGAPSPAPHTQRSPLTKDFRPQLQGTPVIQSPSSKSCGSSRSSVTLKALMTRVVLVMGCVAFGWGGEGSGGGVGWAWRRLCGAEARREAGAKSEACLSPKGELPSGPLASEHRGEPEGPPHRSCRARPARPARCRVKDDLQRAKHTQLQEPNRN